MRESENEKRKVIKKDKKISKLSIIIEKRDRTIERLIKKINKIKGMEDDI